MPGKLAAARASREATERIAALPRRAGSTQSGLPPELEDASAGDASSAYTRASGARGGRPGGTETGLVPNPKQLDCNGSSQSVTFLVISGQHAQQHGTPTATAAALAGIPAPVSGGPQPRATSTAALLTVQASGGSGPRSAAPGDSGSGARASPRASSEQPVSVGPSSSKHTGEQQAVPAAGPWRNSGSSSSLQSSKPYSQRGQPQQRAPLHHPSHSSAADASPGLTGGGASATPAATPAAVGLPATADAAGSVGVPGASPVGSGASNTPANNARSLDMIWTAAASAEGVRASATSAIPLRHSRLRTVVPPSGTATTAVGATAAGSPRDVDGSAPPSGSVASGHGSAKHASQLTRGGSEDMAPGLAAHYMTSQSRTNSVGAWAAAAQGTGGGGRLVSTVDSGSAGGGGTTGSNSQALSRGRGGAPRRSGPSNHGAGLGTASELFAEAGGARAADEAPPSAESSFTMRQTPSDAEDELLERARARRAMRSVTLAAMGAGVGSPTAEAAAAAAATAAAAAAVALARSAQVAAGPEGEAGRRMIIRLNHQPGHNRRPPNRHSSMPAMKRDGVGGPGGTCGGGGGPRRSPLTRPPLSGGLLAEESVPENGELEGSVAVDDNQSNASLTGGLLGTDVGGGIPAGAGGANRTAGISRVPSDSPITSQVSVASSLLMPGPGSTAQQRYQSLGLQSAGGATASAGASGAGGVAAGLGLALASAPAISRLAGSGAHVAMPQTVLVRLPDMGMGGSSGQHRGSFEEEAGGGRHTPTLAAGGSGATPPGSHGQLPLSGMGLAAGDRPSHVSSRLLSGAHAQHSSSLAALHKAVEKLMLQDSGLYAKVQASMKGISSLAKETNKLEFTRDASGATVINQYVVVKTLGRGAFGKVKLCLNTLDGQLYAVKMINRAHLLRQLQKPSRPLRRRAPPPRNTSDTGLMNLHLHRTQTDGNLSISHTNISNNYASAAQAAVPARASMDDTSPLAAIMREIAVMKKVDHPHVVRLHEVIDPPGSSYLMMVMEYCEGGCAMETRAQTGLTPMCEDTAREYFRQACLGLDYLHYNNVVHGDLKPENMLVSGSGLLKIADFGSSRFMGGDPMDATKTSCTPAFQSPEEIGHMPVDPFAADLWALACCLYTFVFGRLPFVGSCVVDIYRAILTRPHAYPEEVTCSPGLKDLLDRMLDKDPRKRLPLREIGQHPWVTAGGQLPALQFLQSLVGSGGEAPPPVIHVTHAEQVNAIDRSSLVSLLRARLKEKTCQPGEYLFKEGEEAHCVYMIMGGVVELTQHLRRPVGAIVGGHGNHHHGGGGGQPGSNGGPGGGAHGAAPGGGGGADGGGGVLEAIAADLHDASFSVDLDESLTLDHPEGGQLITEAMNIVDGKLHIDRQQAIEMRRRMQGTLLGENAEYVVEVKGPGSVIGEMGLDTSVTATHRVSARARGPVTVVKLTEENFFKALLQMYGGTGGAGGSSITTSSHSEAASRGPGHGAGHGISPGPPMPGLSAQHLMVMQYLEDSGSYATFPVAPHPASASGAGVPGRFSMDAQVGRAGHYQHPAAAGHPHHLSSQHQYQHQQQQQQQQQQQVASPPVAVVPQLAVAVTNDNVAAACDAAAAAPAPASPRRASSNGTAVCRVSGAGVGGGGGMRTARVAAGSCGVAAVRTAGPSGTLATFAAAKNSGINSLLGVLNTIHSVNASRADPTTSEEGVADL